MNKFILFPLIVMITISFLGIYQDMTYDPSEEIGGDNNNLGVIRANGAGIYIWEYNGTYEGFFANEIGYYPYDPRDAPANEFRLITNSGKTYTYSNLDDFLDHWNVDDLGQKDSKIKDIFDTNIIWGAIVAILGATIALGVKVFGTGLSEFSQKTAFLGLTWGIFWGFLTITSWDLLIESVLGIYGELLYTTLTLGFIVGIILEVTRGD